jgi:hypothetical protein
MAVAQQGAGQLITASPTSARQTDGHVDGHYLGERIVCKKFRGEMEYRYTELAGVGVQVDAQPTTVATIDSSDARHGFLLTKWDRTPKAQQQLRPGCIVVGVPTTATATWPV